MNYVWLQLISKIYPILTSYVEYPRTQFSTGIFHFQMELKNHSKNIK